LECKFCKESWEAVEEDHRVHHRFLHRDWDQDLRDFHLTDHYIRYIYLRDFLRDSYLRSKYLRDQLIRDNYLRVK
jgi:hypothetical protein